MNDIERDAARYRWLERNAYFGGDEEFDSFQYEMTVDTGVSAAAHTFRNIPVPDLGDLIDAEIEREAQRNGGDA